jgi:hypothetical protein
MDLRLLQAQTARLPKINQTSAVCCLIKEGLGKYQLIKKIIQINLPV